jgi:hypothetical protein
MPTTVVPVSIKAQLDAKAKDVTQRIQNALDKATKNLADNIVREARDDISGAGNFGTRWTQGFTADVDEQGKLVRVITFHQAVPYWKIFQYGGVIHGRPLLWIPLEKGGPRARDYGGRLFRVDRRGGGAPLLMSADDKQVKYTGHEQVRIPKKFHLLEIIRAEAQTLGALYRVEMTSG